MKRGIQLYSEICTIASACKISQPLLHESHNYFRDKSIILQKTFATITVVLWVSGKIPELNFSTNLFNPVSEAVKIISVSDLLYFECLDISHKLYLNIK